MHISQIQSVYLAIALCGIAVQAYTLVLLNRRKMQSEFPIFFQYSAFCIVASALSLVPFVFYCPQYFYYYSVMNTITMVLEFGLLYELLVNTLKPYSALIDLGKMLFRWAAVFLVLAALLTAFATTGASHNKIVVATELLQRTVRLMQCGMLLLFFGLEKRLGISWRNHSMSIAIGLGTFAAVDLCTTYLIDHMPAYGTSLQIFTDFVALGAIFFWAYSFARQEPSRANVLESPSRLIFQRWNEALVSSRFSSNVASAATISGIDSFLPNVEQTVERILARKMVQ